MSPHPGPLQGHEGTCPTADRASSPPLTIGEALEEAVAVSPNPSDACSLVPSRTQGFDGILPKSWGFLLSWGPMGACLPPPESLMHHFSEQRGGPSCAARGSVVTGELLMGGPEDLGRPQNRNLLISPLQMCPSQCLSSTCPHLGRGLKPHLPMRLVPQGPEGSVAPRKGQGLWPEIYTWTLLPRGSAPRRVSSPAWPLNHGHPNPHPQRPPDSIIRTQRRTDVTGLGEGKR